MKRKSNRLLSILLTMVMLLSILPTTAFAADTYTITFKDGGGSGTMDPVTVEAGTEYTLPKCMFSNEGYEFKAWAYNSNVGEQLQPGTKITIRGDIRLYAVWQAKSYTITAVSEDENKGTVTGGGTYEYSEQALLKATPKEGYVFEGWYEDGLRVTGSSSQQFFFVSGDATYTAKFTKADDIITAANAVIDAPAAGASPDMTPVASDPDKYTVTFYKWYDSSYNEMSAEDTFEGGKEYELRVVFEAKEGYKFEGTTFTVNGEATEVFTDENPYSVTRRKIKFQVPAAATYPVTVENGKINIDGGTSSGSYAPDSIVAIVANAPESGKRFKEWVSNDVFFANATAAETSFRMPAKAVTVTATYEDIPAITYTVSFNANGGTGTMADATGISGEYTLPANEFTAPDGKQFKAWSVGGVEKAAHEKITVTANTTVTALWEDIPVAPKTLDSIAITTPPTKTAYTAGESFDSTGMVVTATYSDSSTAPVTGYTVAPDGVLGMSNTEITVTYNEDGVIKTATQPITVTSAGGSGSGDSGSDDSGSDDTSTVTPSTPSVPEFVNPFTDVSEGDYFYDAVKWAVTDNVTTGTTDTTFSPDMVCSRAQAVTFLYRAAGSPDAKGEMPFSDVAEDAYYHDAVLWAIEKGITKGISETEFAPDAVCTREQIVTFLYRTAIGLGMDVSVGEDTNILSYDDALDIGEWAIPAMQWACGAGVMNGTSESTLSPQMECTRGQIVTFLYRAFAE